MANGQPRRSFIDMTRTRTHPLRAVAVAGALLCSAAALAPGSGSAASTAVTLHFFSKTTAMVVTRADGKVITAPPYPKLAKGDVLDIYSLDYVGTHGKHAAAWTASQHLRCTFVSAKAAPACESDVAMQGGALLIFRGAPGAVVAGTGRYAGASGRVIADKEVAGGSDVVARIVLGS
jgi:hypothetical protein